LPLSPPTWAEISTRLSLHFHFAFSLGVFLSVTEFQFSGYIFLEFSNHQNAAEAVAATNNLKLDKQHTFTVNLFSGTVAYLAFIIALLNCLSYLYPNQ
jgi:hypothetical protein